MRGATTVTGAAASGSAGRERLAALTRLMTPLVAWAAACPWALPLLAAGAGIALRLWLVAHTSAMIDADEALVGIQAERILQGQFPVYFYGQAYMGVLEAYLAAPLVALLGPTGWALRLVPIALSPLLVYLTWRLARAVLPAGAATTPLLAGIAACFAAAPPLYDAVAELRTWGGQIEIYIITLALLLCVLELADRLRAGAGAWELARRWAVLGALAGLGFWINPLITYGLITATLWLAPPLVARALPRLAGRLRRHAQDAARPWLDLSVALPALALLPGMALGGLPAWIYAARHSGENLLVYVTQPTVTPDATGAARYGRVVLGAAITFRYATCVAPSVLDGATPFEPLALLPLRLALLLPPVVAAVCGLWLLRRRAAAPLRVGLPLLYAGAVTAVFCLGTSAWASTKPCSWDLTGRYAVPLALVEPLLLLALLALPAAVADWRGRWSRRATTTDAVAAPTIPARDDASGSRALTAGGASIVAALLVAGALQVATYGLVSPTQTFQSPYYRRIPSDTSQVLAYLKAHHISAAWCNHWLGNIITYQTNGATICADYYDQVYLNGLRRPPGTLQTVAHAERPSFILIVADLHPILAQELDAQGIAYSIAVFPAAGVTIVTPARTVAPATVVPGLGQDYLLSGRSPR
jgi:hypothetical protein